MGDKSPKAKDKAKKHDSAAKNQKKVVASNKANAFAASSKQAPASLHASVRGVDVQR